MLSLPILSPVLCLSWDPPNKPSTVLSLCQRLPSGRPTVAPLRVHGVKPVHTENKPAAMVVTENSSKSPLCGIFTARGVRNPSGEADTICI